MIMLLLDRNNEPTKTIYYLAAVCYQLIRQSQELETSELFQRLQSSRIEYQNLSYIFFILALDFLFLLDRVEVNERGMLYVN